MICCICDAPRTLGGKEIVLTPVVKVWCCDDCVDAVLLNACRNAFRERCEEVKI